MKTKMLDYTKQILTKVSFDRALFEKELIKSLKLLVLYEEIEALHKWCLRKFSYSYRTVIEDVFGEYEMQRRLDL